MNLDRLQFLEDCFKRMEIWAPESQKAQVGRISAHLKSFSPDDEILKILEVLGLLTVLTKQVPEEIGLERQKWKQESDQIEKELKLLLEQVLEKTVPLFNSVGSIQTSMSQVIKSVGEVSKGLEETVKETVKKIDSQWIAEHVLQELNSKALGAVSELNQALFQTQKKMSKTLESAQETVHLLKHARWWIPFFVSFSLCSSAFTYYWYSHPRCPHVRSGYWIKGR